MSFSRGALAMGAGRAETGDDGWLGNGYGNGNGNGNGNGRRGMGKKEERTVSSEGETSTTMSFGVFGAGETVGTVQEPQEEEEVVRPTGNGSKLRRLLGTAVKDELGGNVGPSKSDEDIGLPNTADREDSGNLEVHERGEVVEMQSRERRPVSDPGVGVDVEQRGVHRKTGGEGV